MVVVVVVDDEEKAVVVVVTLLCVVPLQEVVTSFVRIMLTNHTFRPLLLPFPFTIQNMFKPHSSLDLLTQSRFLSLTLGELWRHATYFPMSQAINLHAKLDLGFNLS